MAQYEIYSKTSGGLRGDLIEKYSKFTATLRFNEVGKWSLSGSGIELCPLAENGGIIVYRDGIPFISGFVTKIDEEFDETFEDATVINWEASGLDDNGLLTRRIIIPDPVNLNMTAEAYQTIQNYGGNAILDFIATQAGQQAHADRKISNLDVGNDLNVGSVKTYKARLDNLWEFIIGIAENQTLGVRVIWDGVSGSYEAQVYSPEDKSSTIIFSRELGNLKKWKRTREAPKANALWVAGQGELTDRMFSYKQDATSISKWGRYEGFKDQRQISKEQDPDDSRTPQEILDEAAAGFLSENLETEGYELELAPLDRLVYRTDWELGDIVQVRIGTDSYNALIEEVKIEYADMTEKIIPCVGTIDRGTISKTYQTIQSLSDRVTTLEKDEGIMDVFNDHVHDGTDSKKIAYSNLTGLPQLTPAGIGALPSNPLCIELFPTSSTAGNGGYIDFHYNRSSVDYTSRIIEQSSGTITVGGNLSVTGTIRGDDTGWIAPTLLNSWVNYGGSHAIAGYRKIGMVVYLRGLLKNGSAANAVFFTLPSGYRPAYKLIFTSFSTAGACRIDVDTNGNVNAYTNGSTTWTALDGISFLVD